MVVALQLLMSHSKSVGHINKISKVTSKLFEVTMFRLVPHCPVANQRPITIESKDQSINKAYNIMHIIVHGCILVTTQQIHLQLHQWRHVNNIMHTLTGASIEAYEQWSASWG